MITVVICILIGLILGWSLCVISATGAQYDELLRELMGDEDDEFCDD